MAKTENFISDNWRKRAKLMILENDNKGHP